MTRGPLTIEQLLPSYAARTLLQEWKEKVWHPAACTPIVFSELQLGLGNLGSGGFKDVQKGPWNRKEVAVATSRGNDALLEEELKVMQLMGRHPHILTLYGVARDPRGKEHIVLELATNGSLEDALFDLNDQGRQLHPLVLLGIAQQVCEAMQAIAHAGLIHCDLAARNFLLSSPLEPDDPRSVNAKVRIFPPCGTK